MPELEDAVYQWKRSYIRSEIGHHPTIWAGHFGDSFLGSVWKQTRDPEWAVWLAAPFTISADIKACFLALDVAGRLRMTRMASEGNGARITNWTMKYGVTDWGEPTFGYASYEHEPAFPVAVDRVVNARLTEDLGHSFATAWAAVLR